MVNPVQFGFNWLECHDSCSEDSLCIGIGGTETGCTECSDTLLNETQTNAKLGACDLGIHMND